MQVESVQEVGEDARDAELGEVGVGVHRFRVCSERQRRGDAAVGAQEWDDVVPESSGHEEAVAEDDDGSGAAGVLVVDGTRG